MGFWVQMKLKMTARMRNKDWSMNDRLGINRA